MKILIAEDDPTIRDLYYTFLSVLEGHVVRMVGNGRDALNILATATFIPDVIILDWLMPVLNGAGFLQAIREQGYSYPVLVVTASISYEQDVHRYLPGEQVSLLTKPFGIDDLLTRLVSLHQRGEQKHQWQPNTTAGSR